VVPNVNDLEKGSGEGSASRSLSLSSALRDTQTRGMFFVNAQTAAEHWTKMAADAPGTAEEEEKA
jgi:hypothetical protein